MAENNDRDNMKSISDKLTWALVFLFIIMLNTCSLSDDIEDALRDRREPAPAPTAINTPTPTPAQG